MSKTFIDFSGAPLSSGGTVDIAAIRQQLAPSFVDQTGDSGVGSLSMSTGSTISNIPNPVNATDAANKNYVDSVVSTAVGGTFTQTQADARYLKLTGGTQTGNILMNNGATVTGLPNPVNNTDAANKNYVNRVSVFEPGIISSQNPYFHFCADAYNGTEASAYDLSSNNQTITFLNFSGVTGTTTFFNNLNNHRYVTFTNRGFNISTSNVGVYTAFAVIQYISASTPSFVFGLNASSSVNPIDFHDGSISGAGLTNAIMSSNWASSNSFNNFYLNGSQVNASALVKPTGWFLYAFTSSTAANVGTMFIDRGGQWSTTAITRYGGASLAEAIMFTSQLSNVAFQQITDYLLSKYGLTWSYSTPLIVNPVVNTICGTSGGTAKACLTLDGTSLPTADISMNSKKITNLSDPTNPQDAVTKNYADGKLSQSTADGRYLQLTGGSMTGSLQTPNLQGNQTIYNLTFTTSSVTGYTPMCIIGESSGAAGTYVNLNNDSTTFPNGAGANCSFSFGMNGSNVYSFYVESVTGTTPNRAATVWINVTGVNFSTAVTISLNNKFTGTSLQSGTNTFMFFDNFSGTSLNNSLWGGAANVVVNNGVTVGTTATNTGSLLSTVSQQFNDTMELVGSFMLANTTQSYIGIGFDNFCIENAWESTGTSYIANGLGPPASNGITTITKLSNSAYQRVRLARVGTAGRVIVGSNTVNVTLPNPTGSNIIMTSYDANTYTRCQYVFVRKYVVSEPVFTSSSTTFILNVSTDINLSNSKIIQLSNPVNAQDAVTKNYVDSNTLNQNAGDARYLKLSGGTMTGILDMNNRKITNLTIGSITNPGDAAAVANVNAVVNTICSTQGGNAVTCLRCDGQNNPTANLTMNNFRLTNLGNATSSSDAINSNVFLMASGTLPSTGNVNTDIALITFPTGYNIANGKILICSIWFERESGFWEPTSAPHFISTWGTNLQLFSRDSENIFKYYNTTSPPSGWSLKWRIQYIQKQ
jgi:Domain of unknown function (DUF2341)